MAGISVTISQRSLRQMDNPTTSTMKDRTMRSRDPASPVGNSQPNARRFRSAMDCETLFALACDVLPELMTLPDSQGSPNDVNLIATEYGRIAFLICADTFSDVHFESASRL